MPKTMRKSVWLVKIWSAWNKEDGRWKNRLFLFSKVWTLRILYGIVLCYRRYNTMSIIKELWHGNIIPQEDSRTNSKEMKELLGYMARHHEDLEKSFTDEQKEIFEKFHDCWSEYMSLAEVAIFEYAFKLGMQIATESLVKWYNNLYVCYYQHILIQLMFWRNCFQL